MKIWHLKQEDKWARDTESQIKAIRELGTFGMVALPALEEIQAINAREEIKQCCIETIKNMNYQKPERLTNTKDSGESGDNRTNKKNQQQEGIEKIEGIVAK